MNKTFLLSSLILVSLLITISCKQEKEIGRSNSIFVHLQSEPDFLHPMISIHASASQIESQIFQPLIEYDPIDLLFKPILAEKLAKGTIINHDSLNPIYEFVYLIRKEAKWQDGKDVVATDYEFTVKAANNPMLPTNSWKSFLSSIDTIILDKNNPKYIKVRVKQNQYFAELMSANFQIYPRHHYDPKNILANYSLHQLRTQDSITDKKFIQFTNQFRSSKMGRDSILGSGPYHLLKWTPQRQISIERTNAWWANDISNYPNSFRANPQNIKYEIIPDEVTSITLLQDGKLDVMGQISPSIFDRLKKDSLTNQTLNFYSPNTMRSYYLGLNGWDPILKEKSVRRALAHCLDVDLLIKTLMKGNATRTTGPIHPQKPYYNDTISPIKYDLKLAAKILEKANWKIFEHDLIRSKKIDGKKTMLSLEILVTQKELGKKLALLLKNNALLIGIDIQIITSKWSNILKKLKSHDFQITPMKLSQSPGMDDLGQSWHTSSSVGGKNYYGYGNKYSDSLIYSINHISDQTELYHNFRKIQSDIYEEQPVIFLFTPTANIAINKRIKPVVSSKRPGYFEALFIPIKHQNTR